MTTVATMVERVRRDIYGGHRPQLNVLASDVAAGAGMLTMQLPLDGISVNQLISVDNEIFWTKSYERNSLTVGVLPAMFGTTTAAHVAGTVCEVGARWHRAQIFDTMFEEIVSWPDRIYRIAAIDLPYAMEQRGYPLAVPAGFHDVLEVLRAPDVVHGSASNGSWARVPYRIERELPVGSFPSGVGLFVERPHTTGVMMRVIYSYPFDLDTWTDTTDLEAEVGLSAGHLDILKYGTLWRLASTGETARTDPSANHDERNDAHIPGGLNTNNARVLGALRDKRIDDESRRIIGTYKLPGW